MEVTKKGKKGPGLKIVCAQPEPVPTVPSNLDKSTTISINGKKLNIAADDLQFVCSLGEFECSSSLWDMASVACSYLPKPCWCFCVGISHVLEAHYLQVAQKICTKLKEDLKVNYMVMLVFFSRVFTHVSITFLLIVLLFCKGKGAYGVVDKMMDKATGTTLAVKRITATMDTIEQRRMLMDLEVLRQLPNHCPYTVHFYGAMFREGDLWICMEVLDASLDKFYPVVFSSGGNIPEPVLGKIAFSLVYTLHYLHANLKVMHRDVKPSNILVNRKGEVKMCDFGISGYLVDSVAKTIDAGCKPYMAPERIDPPIAGEGYNVRSDVWSFGITMVEIAEGKFPYKIWSSPFEQLKQV